MHYSSLVQSASLDLHVGTIFVPPKDEPKPGEVVDRRPQYTLQPGQAIMVDTEEDLNFPSDIAAFGFPPTSISDRAILMTNPGHIDPGFKGKLSFTLINMGREPFLISKGQTVVTLLLVELSQMPQADFSKRNPSFSQSDLSPYELHSLGRDFLDLDVRARKAAETVVRDENTRIRKAEVWIPILAALIAAVAAFIGASIQSKQAVADLEKKIAGIEVKVETENRFKGIESKLNQIESASQKNTNTSTKKNP